MKGMWCNILAKSNMRIIKNEIFIPDQSEVDLVAFGAVGKSVTVGQTRRTRKGAREKSDNPVIVSFHLLALFRKAVMIMCIQ